MPTTPGPSSASSDDIHLKHSAVHSHGSPPASNQPTSASATSHTAPTSASTTPNVSLKRKRITLACHRCRQKKGKCDGKKPVCSTCESAGSSCEWPDPELDGRKHKKMSNATRARKHSSGGGGTDSDRPQGGGRGTPTAEDDEDSHYYQHSKRVSGPVYGLGGPGEVSLLSASNGNGHGHPLNGADLYHTPSAHRPRHTHSTSSMMDRRSTSSPQPFTHSAMPSHSHSLSHPSSSSRSGPLVPHGIIHPGRPPSPPPSHHTHLHGQSPLDVLLAAALPGSHSQWGGSSSTASASRSHHHPAVQGVGMRDTGMDGPAASISNDGMDVPMDYSHPARSLGPLNTNTSTNEPPMVLHYNRPFGPTAIQPGLERISIAFRAPIPGSRCPSPSPPDSLTSPTVTSSSTSNSIPDIFSSNLSSSFSFEPIYYTRTPAYFPDNADNLHATTLTVTSSDSPYDPSSDIPKPIVLQKLIPLFFERMGSHFPFLTEGMLLSNIDHPDPGRRVTAPLIINAVCALGARFSDIPIMRSQARDTTSQSPATYGIPFAEKMKQLLVPLLGFPTSNTVAALLFLAYFSFGLNNEGALWTYSGMALRMAVDLGLHQIQDVGQKGKVNDRERVQRASDRLLWWSCFILDRTLAFGTGRPVTVKDKEIKALLPTEEEILVVQQAEQFGSGDPLSPDIGGSGHGLEGINVLGGLGGSAKAPSPFPYHVRMFQLYGSLAETINVVEPSWRPPKVDMESHANGHGREGGGKAANHDEGGDDDATNLAEAENTITSAYHSLPELMVFNAENLRIHAKHSSSPTFLALHLWYNTIIIMLYRPPLIHPRVNAAHSSLQDRLAVVNNSCLAITNILNSADLVDPFAYLASPFVNQCFFVAGSAWILDHRIRTGRDVLASSSSGVSVNPNGTSASTSTSSSDLHPPVSASRHASHSPSQPPYTHKLLNSSTSILAQMAISNFKLCKKALSRQSQYWMGVKWIEAVVDRYASATTRRGGLNEGVDTFVSPAEMAIFRRLVKRTTGESPLAESGTMMLSEEMVRALSEGGLKGMSEDDWALAYSFASFTAGPQGSQSGWA
ncbi:hypothetical protein PM082_015791 [Marasmius tenuissimus]|nr:hypothetical protein PM082_015791 [Marasmius tenuissimus]